MTLEGTTERSAGVELETDNRIPVEALRPGFESDLRDLNNSFSIDRVQTYGLGNFSSAESVEDISMVSRVVGSADEVSFRESMDRPQSFYDEMYDSSTLLLDLMDKFGSQLFEESAMANFANNENILRAVKSNNEFGRSEFENLIANYGIEPIHSATGALNLLLAFKRAESLIGRNNLEALLAENVDEVNFTIGLVLNHERTAVVFRRTTGEGEGFGGSGGNGTERSGGFSGVESEGGNIGESSAEAGGGDFAGVDNPGSSSESHGNSSVNLSWFDNLFSRNSAFMGAVGTFFAGVSKWFGRGRSTAGVEGVESFVGTVERPEDYIPPVNPIVNPAPEVDPKAEGLGIVEEGDEEETIVEPSSTEESIADEAAMLSVGGELGQALDVAEGASTDAAEQQLSEQREEAREAAQGQAASMAGLVLEGSQDVSEGIDFQNEINAEIAAEDEVNEPLSWEVNEENRGYRNENGEIVPVYISDPTARRFPEAREMSPGVLDRLIEDIRNGDRDPGPVFIEYAQNYMFGDPNIAALDPNDPAAQGGYYEAAIRMFEAAEEYGATNVLTDHHMATCHLALGNYREAIAYYAYVLDAERTEELAQALELEPYLLFSTYNNLAYAYYVEGDYDLAYENMLLARERYDGSIGNRDLILEDFERISEAAEASGVLVS